MTPISLDTIQFTGSGLKRPECVLCTSDGVIHTSNWAGGISRITPDGQTRHLVANPVTAPLQVKPNGICLQQDGSYLLAHLGEETGACWVISLPKCACPSLDIHQHTGISGTSPCQHRNNR